MPRSRHSPKRSNNQSILVEARRGKKGKGKGKGKK
jgi:hypothetical protein